MRYPLLAPWIFSLIAIATIPKNRASLEIYSQLLNEPHEHPTLVAMDQIVDMVASRPDEKAFRSSGGARTEPIRQLRFLFRWNI